MQQIIGPTNIDQKRPKVIADLTSNIDNQINQVT